jgi:hypothetical protein
MLIFCRKGKLAHFHAASPPSVPSALAKSEMADGEFRNERGREAKPAKMSFTAPVTFNTLSR